MTLCANGGVEDNVYGGTYVCIHSRSCKPNRNRFVVRSERRDQLGRRYDNSGIHRSIKGGKWDGSLRFS